MATNHVTTYCRSSAFVGSSAQRYCVWEINGLRKAVNTNADVIESAKKTEQIFQDTLEALKKLRRNCNDSPQWARSNLIDRQLACLADSINNFSTKMDFGPNGSGPPILVRVYVQPVVGAPYNFRRNPQSVLQSSHK